MIFGCNQDGFESTDSQGFSSNGSVTQEDEKPSSTLFYSKTIEEASIKLMDKSPYQMKKEDFLEIKKLKFVDAGIFDIRDIAMFSNLEVLDLSGNIIDDYSPLLSLKKLKKLKLKGNAISDISFMSGFSELESLNLANNKIEDITALARLSVKKLNLKGNDIFDLSVLFSKVELESLDISNLPYRIDISSLSELSKLKHLNISRNKVIREEYLQDLTSLKTLICNNMKEFDFSSLGRVDMRLKKLTLKNNNLLQVGFLLGLSSIKVLDLSNNRLDKDALSVISTLLKLRNLNLAKNFISGNLDFSTLSELKKISLRDNALKDKLHINFADKVKIKKLNLSFNKLTAVVFLNRKKIKKAFKIDLRDNLFQDINTVLIDNPHLKGFVKFQGIDDSDLNLLDPDTEGVRSIASE